MFSSKHDPVGLTWVKYSHETGEKHDIEAVHTCVSNMQMHAKGFKRRCGLGASIEYSAVCVKVNETCSDEIESHMTTDSELYSLSRTKTKTIYSLQTRWE